MAVRAGLGKPPPANPSGVDSCRAMRDSWAAPTGVEAPRSPADPAPGLGRLTGNEAWPDRGAAMAAAARAGAGRPSDCVASRLNAGASSGAGAAPTAIPAVARAGRGAAELAATDGWPTSDARGCPVRAVIWPAPMANSAEPAAAAELLCGACDADRVTAATCEASSARLAAVLPGAVGAAATSPSTGNAVDGNCMPRGFRAKEVGWAAIDGFGMSGEGCDTGARRATAEGSCAWSVAAGSVWLAVSVGAGLAPCADGALATATAVGSAGSAALAGCVGAVATAGAVASSVTRRSVGRSFRAVWLGRATCCGDGVGAVRFARRGWLSAIWLAAIVAGTSDISAGARAGAA